MNISEIEVKVIGSIIGTVFSIIGALITQEILKEREKRKKQKEDEEILYLDLQVLFKKLQQNCVINPIIVNLREEDKFYEKLNRIFRIEVQDEYDEILSSKERVEIITKSKKLKKEEKIQLINFLTLCDSIFANEFDFKKFRNKFYKIYNQCKSTYYKIYNYVLPIDEILKVYVDYDGNRTIFDDTLMQFNKYLNCYYEDFFGVSNSCKNENYYFSDVEKKFFNFNIVGLEKFSIKSKEDDLYDFRTNIFTYKNTSNEENTIDISKIEYKNKYNEYEKQNSIMNNIEKAKKYKMLLLKKCDINENFNDTLDKIKTDYPEFAIENGVDKFNELKLEVDKEKKLLQVAKFICKTYEYSNKEKEGFELKGDPIKYRKNEYFHENNINDFIDFSLAQVMIPVTQYITYLQNCNDLKYKLLPELFNLIYPNELIDIDKVYLTDRIEKILDLVISKIKN